jgi:hypothetical protein
MRSWMETWITSCRPICEANSARSLFRLGSLGLHVPATESLVPHYGAWAQGAKSFDMHTGTREASTSRPARTEPEQGHRTRCPTAPITHHRLLPIRFAWAPSLPPPTKSPGTNRILNRRSHRMPRPTPSIDGLHRVLRARARLTVVRISH